MLAVSDIEADVLDVAGRLSGAPVTAIARVGGGRNSRVFRVDTARGPFALKQYPSSADDRRDRLGTEAAALGWMAEQGFEMVPQVVAIDRASNSSLLSWVEGELVRDVSASDVDQAVDFLGRLHAARGTTRFPAEPRDPEACLSGAEIERQLRKRIADLQGLDGEAALRKFITEDLSPALDAILGRARAASVSSGRPFDSELELSKRSLVASDFGFHNMLRDRRGRLTFIDFEYFGWDDPVKLTADMLLHPGTSVPAEMKTRFRHAAERLYSDDPDFAARLAAYLPLFAARWALILLNEFHPERWRKRVLAGADYDWREAKQRQLAAARTMLQDVVA